MDQAMIQNLHNVMTELKNADNDYVQCAADENTALPDLTTLWARQIADCKAANVRIKLLSPAAVRRVPAS
eukprot:13169476-Heterocapsa_arctica.AAC.1